MDSNSQFVERSAKVLVIGNSSVGKTSLILRYLDNFYCDNFLPTVGIDFKSKTVNYKGNTIKLHIWDTAGQEKYRTLTANYFNGAQAVIFVFDVFDRLSFNKLQEWIADTQRKVQNKFIGVIVGNKIDLVEEQEVEVQEEEAYYYGEDVGMPVFFASAKTGIHVEQVFQKIIEEIVKGFQYEAILESAFDLEKDKQKNTVRKKGLKAKFRKCC